LGCTHVDSRRDSATEHPSDAVQHPLSNRHSLFIEFVVQYPLVHSLAVYYCLAHALRAGVALSNAISHAYAVDDAVRGELCSASSRVTREVLR
jgi:hypothetical protein